MLWKGPRPMKQEEQEQEQGGEMNPFTNTEMFAYELSNCSQILNNTEWHPERLL